MTPLNLMTLDPRQRGAKIGIGLVTTFTPVGWIYGVADIGFQVVSGTSLTDRAGNFIDNY
jgi:hypothetical protein